MSRPEWALLTGKERENGLPSLPKVHGCGEKQDLKRGVDRINTVVEQLSQRPTLVCPPSLTSINRIERLV